jgi:HSP20 family protein
VAAAGYPARFPARRAHPQGQTGRELTPGGQAQAGLPWVPPVEVLERDGQLVVRAEVPGLSKDDVNVEIENDELVLSGERIDEHKDEREGFYQSERSYGRFYRSICLPQGVDPEQAKASFSNGVLEVTMPAPKQQQSRGRKIEVRER